MKTAKLFMTGRSQAVRLPKEFRLEGDEVFVKRHGNAIVLTPKDNFDWSKWFESLADFDVNILEEGRVQPEQKRDGLDDLFT
jgi:antitoxin VapB